MKKISRETIQQMLINHVCLVEFTKVNGEKRSMPCTLRADVIPSVPIIEGKEPKEKKINQDVMSVWCTDKNGWRSFRIENVTNLLILDEKQNDE